VRVAVTQTTWDALAHKLDRLGDFQPEIVYGQERIEEVDPLNAADIARVNALPSPALVTVTDHCPLPVVTAFRVLAAQIDVRHPILLKDCFKPPPNGFEGDFLDALLTSAARLGSLLCDGIGDAVLVRMEPAPGQSLRVAYNTLQAAGTRIFKTDYVACPSCGRTLFDLQSTTARIKAATDHLKGVKIAVMGCIFNGPGEMADADFGYVGGAPGKVNLYVGKQAVKFNIPS